MSYNAEKMWDSPRPPFGAFRGRTGESYPPRGPHGAEPRMRGRGPLPFRGGAMPHGGPYSNQGGPPSHYRDVGRGQEGSWEESRPAPKEQMSIPRRAGPPAGFRDVSDMRYSEQALAPDMDYRDREVMEQRKWTTPDVDYRLDDSSIGYRVRLPPPSRRLISERDDQEREAYELEHQKRLGAAMDYRQGEFPFREREYPERLRREKEALRDREGAALGYRDGESAAMGFSDREASALTYQERNIVDYTERGLPAHVKESADRDLRMKESEKGIDLSKKYSESGTVSIPYGEQEKTDVEYMDVEHQKNESLNTGPVKDNAGFTSVDKGSAEMPYRQGETSHVNYKKEFPAQRAEFQKPIDADYRGKECTDSDYRGKESSDSDYRGPENADLKFQETKTSNLTYQETKTADSDYRGKESTDSDYRKRERTDADYRQSTEDYVKESADKMETGRDFLSSSLKEDSKGLSQAKLTTDYPLISAEESTGPKKVEIIPFLTFTEEELSTLANIIVEAHSKSPAEAQAPTRSEPSCPGKLDTDFRGRTNPEGIGSGARERSEKDAGYTAHTIPKGLSAGDQDLRSKASFAKDPNKVEGDQDLRTSGQTQKDEDLRGGEAKAPEEFFTQNFLLMDFLRLAAKELREKTTNISEVIDEPIAVTPAIPNTSTAKSFHPDLIARPARPMVPGSSMAPGIEFLCREDTDYRNMDFNDVDLRVAHRPDKRLREDPQPGGKDKDYRRTPVPEGATKIIWLDGLPTGGSREEILCALGSAHTMPEDGVNLIGYIPGYSTGSVCVEFSLVEEAVGCMEANKGAIHFKGKKVSLKYIPNSDRWSCLQCKAVNALSKERCWQCSALRVGSDHLSLRDAHKEPKTPPSLSSQRSKKRKSKRSPSGRSPDRRKEKTPPRERSSSPKTRTGTKQPYPVGATVIIRGICVTTSPESVVKALQPYAQLSPSNVRIMKNRKSNQRGFGFIDLKSHKEAIRLTVLVRELKPPLTIDGNAISVDLAIGQRRSEGKSQKGSNSSSGKNRKQKSQSKPFTYPGFRGNAEEGPSYIYDPNTGCYVDPLTESYYNEGKAEKKDDYSCDKPEKDRKEKRRNTKRGFTEEKETSIAFKLPLPPTVTKKEEPEEPKVNPLLGLIGAYVEDSEEEEEKDEEILPPLSKKPAPSSPPPAPTPAPKPVVKPAPIPVPAPAPKPVAKPLPKPELKPTPAALSTSDHDKLMDWKKMVCLLCRRQFPNKEALIRHKNLSELHKQNIALYEKTRKSQKQLEYLQQKEQE